MLESPLSPLPLQTGKHAAQKQGPWPLLSGALGIAAVSWLLSSLLAADPATVDALMRFQNALISPLFSLLAGAAPFSIAEMLLLITPVALCVMLLRAFVLLALRRMPVSRFLGGVLTCALVASALYAAFVLGWGLNYHRPPLSDELGLQMNGCTNEQLAALYADLISDANTYRAQLPEDDQGVFDPGDKDDILRQVPKAYAQLGAVWPRFAQPFPAAKRVLLSRYMSYSGITGIYIPFTYEANVNYDTPKLMLYAVAAHETAHLGGVAPEDEANFVAYLACIYSRNAAMHYSGDMLAIIYAGNALLAADEESFSTIRETMSDALVRDLQDYSDYWKQFEGPVQEQMNDVNDAYLKRNGQQDGTRSYGRMVDLLLAWKGY